MRIYFHHDRFMVFQVKQLLDDNGVPCYIKNEFASGAIGELAPLDSLPEVWLVDDEWESRAQSLIANLQVNSPSPSSPWICSNCRESNEASFEVCWNCGSEP